MSPQLHGSSIVTHGEHQRSPWHAVTASWEVTKSSSSVHNQVTGPNTKGDLLVLLLFFFLFFFFFLLLDSRSSLSSHPHARCRHCHRRQDQHELASKRPHRQPTQPTSQPTKNNKQQNHHNNSNNNTTNAHVVPCCTQICGLSESCQDPFNMPRMFLNDIKRFECWLVTIGYTWATARPHAGVKQSRIMSFCSQKKLIHKPCGYSVARSISKLACANSLQ